MEHRTSRLKDAPIAVVLVVDPPDIYAVFSHHGRQSLAGNNTESHEFDGLSNGELLPVGNLYNRVYYNMTAVIPVYKRVLNGFNGEVI